MLWSQVADADVLTPSASLATTSNMAMYGMVFGRWDMPVTSHTNNRFAISRNRLRMHHIQAHSCAMLARARTALAMLMDMREMTSVWKKFATLLVSGRLLHPRLARALLVRLHACAAPAISTAPQQCTACMQTTCPGHCTASRHPHFRLLEPLERAASLCARRRRNVRHLLKAVWRTKGTKTMLECRNG